MSKIRKKYFSKEEIADRLLSFVRNPHHSDETLKIAIFNALQFVERRTRETTEAELLGPATKFFSNDDGTDH